MRTYKPPCYVKFEDPKKVRTIYAITYRGVVAKMMFNAIITEGFIKRMRKRKKKMRKIKPILRQIKREFIQLWRKQLAEKQRNQQIAEFVENYFKGEQNK